MNKTQVLLDKSLHEEVIQALTKGAVEGHQELIAKLQQSEEATKTEPRMSSALNENFFYLLCRAMHPEDAVQAKLAEFMSSMSKRELDWEPQDLTLADIPLIVSDIKEAYERNDFDLFVDLLLLTTRAYVHFRETKDQESVQSFYQHVLNLFGHLSEQDISLLTHQIVDSAKTSATGKPSERSHHQRLSLFCKTNGRYNRVVNRLTQLANKPKLDLSSCQIFSLNQPENRLGFQHNMRSGGYHTFEEPLPRSLCQDIQRESRKLEGTHVPHTFSGWDSPEVKDVKTPLNQLQEEPRAFYCDQEQTLNLPEVQEVLGDPSFVNAARLYLKCEPILGSVNLWWTFPSVHKQSEPDWMAHRFHFDGDYNHFINFFIYLTDTDLTSGAHLYIRGSHTPGTKPQHLLNRGYTRIPEQDLAQHYPSQAFTAIEGNAGTVTAADTRCWHRGTTPSEKPRLMLQFVFTDTLATSNAIASYNVDIQPGSQFHHQVEANPRVYSIIQPNYLENVAKRESA